MKVQAVAAFAVAAAGGLLAAIPAAAASTINLNQDLPTAPVQATVGDVIDITLPPAGFSLDGVIEYPMPTSSDSGVLPKVSGSYDADGTLHEEFTAMKAGTATISVVHPGGLFCPKPTSSTSTSSSSTSSTSTSSSTSMSGPPTVDPGCVAVAAPLPTVVTVVVSAAGVQGAVDVPPTGSAGPSTVGIGLALLGVMVSGVSVLVLRDEQRRRR